MTAYRNGRPVGGFADVEEAELVEALRGVMNDPKAQPNARVQAANALADRGYGKPSAAKPDAEAIDLSVPVPVDPEARAEYVRKLSAAFPAECRAVRARLGLE